MKNQVGNRENKQQSFRERKSTSFGDGEKF